MANGTAPSTPSLLLTRWPRNSHLGRLESQIDVTSLFVDMTGESAFHGLPWWLGGGESTCNAGDPGSIPESGISPGGGHGNPLQYSCLEKPMNRGAWQATVHMVEHD